MAVGLPPQEVVLRWEPPPADSGALSESCRSAAMSGVVSLAADGVGGGGSRGVLGVVAACEVHQSCQFNLAAVCKFTEAGVLRTATCVVHFLHKANLMQL